ncbi:helix-turn-helix domain-containing protein (plasmid) [Streptomyces albidoflavus]|uniref:helix-turn-helix domain-containing protein n=1 Tax=Streptomyces albidoflavus TaxID=1886 RepID=UPI002F916AA2|nr:helix-turn-helix domain-containing protein [Streptomyces albidoflavus]
MNVTTSQACAVTPASRVSPSSDRAAVAAPAEIWVPESSQWLSTTRSRVASDGYTWMQGVHWVAGSGLYQPRRHRRTGLRGMGPMTLYIAQLLSELSPCRPGVTYLTRRTGLTKRAVEYHLAALREAGLLAWIVRGTRVRGAPALASEFALLLPPEFDAALGIRTRLREETAPPYTRAATGISEAGRKVMARLAKRAARRVRKPRKTAPKPPSKTSPTATAPGAGHASGAPVSGGLRCTPMQGGADGVAGAGGSVPPLETTSVASGSSKSPTPKSSAEPRRGRRVNRVGHRFQLAARLAEEVPWLRGAATPRLAWVLRDVADEGWTVEEIRAWLHHRGTPEGHVHRPSGLLAALLRQALIVLDTPAKRGQAVDAWRAAQHAARRDRVTHTRTHHHAHDADLTGPTSLAAQREVAAALTRSAGQPTTEDQLLPEVDGIDQLDPADLQQLRAEAAQQYALGEPGLITDAVQGLGRATAEQLYGPGLVARALRLAATTAHLALDRLTHR